MTDEMREFARKLFEHDEPDDTAEPPSSLHVVPQEGTTPPSPPRDDARDFVCDLFEHDPY